MLGTTSSVKDGKAWVRSWLGGRVVVIVPSQMIQVVINYTIRRDEFDANGVILIETRQGSVEPQHTINQWAKAIIR
jgi:hypothetical protein